MMPHGILGGGFAMALSDWTELENLSGEIADSQSRLAAARSTQNHGLVKLLERQITEAEKCRDRLLSQITARLTTSPGPAARRLEPAAAAAEHPIPAEAAVLSAAPAAEMASVDAAATEMAATDMAPVEPAPVDDALIDMTP